MAKTTFVHGTTVTPDFLNAVNNPVFVSTPSVDGELPLIVNDSLSNVAGQVKPEWTAFRDEFKVSISSGLIIAYQGGTVTLPNNNRVTVASSTITLPANTTRHIYLDTAGAVVAGTSYPLFCFSIAEVTTGASTISTIVDRRDRFRVVPRFNAVKVFGGTGEQGDYTLNSGSATFSDGEYYYQNFTIGAAATLTIDKAAKIFVQGTCTIAGSIVVTTASMGGGSYAGYGASTPSVIGRVTGIGRGAGSSGTGGGTYNYAVESLGSGGAAGGIYPSTGGNNDYALTGAGGNGGGGLIIEAFGQISVTGTITAKGSSGSAPTVVQGSPNVAGSGGGSGGLILLKSATSVAISGTLDVRGGSGGSAIGLTTHGGGGGGGGQIVLISPNNNTTGSSLLIAGAAAGTSVASPTSAGGGGGGFGGSAGWGIAQAGSNGIVVLRNFAPVG